MSIHWKPARSAKPLAEVCESEKELEHEESWHHTRIILKPDSTDRTYKPIVLGNLEDGELTIVADLVEVLGIAG